MTWSETCAIHTVSVCYSQKDTTCSKAEISLKAKKKKKLFFSFDRICSVFNALFRWTLKKTHLQQPQREKGKSSQAFNSTIIWQSLASLCEATRVFLFWERRSKIKITFFCILHTPGMDRWLLDYEWCHKHYLSIDTKCNFFLLFHILKGVHVNVCVMTAACGCEAASEFLSCFLVWLSDTERDGEMLSGGLQCVAIVSRHCGRQSLLFIFGKYIHTHSQFSDLNFNAL